MIDTAKYEGHTPTEEWGDIVYADGYRSIFLNDESDDGLGAVYATDIDRQLMTDAPLLLEEVKRLRAVVAQVWDLMQNSNHQDREAYFWGFDGKNTGWMKVHEELAMRELNWGEEE